MQILNLLKKEKYLTSDISGRCSLTLPEITTFLRGLQEGKIRMGSDASQHKMNEITTGFIKLNGLTDFEGTKEFLFTI